MSQQQLVDSIVRAVLYTGSAVSPLTRRPAKYEARPRYGRLNPAESFTEPASLTTECLVEGFPAARLHVELRFQQVACSHIGALAIPLRRLPAPETPDFYHLVSNLVADGISYEPTEEVVERRVALPEATLRHLLEEDVRRPFAFPATRSLEPIRDQRGWIVGVILRETEALAGELLLSAEPVDAAVAKISVCVVNGSPLEAACAEDRREVALRTFGSTHLVLRVFGGAFLSMIEPRDAYAGAAALCTNLGIWPVLVGDEVRRPRDTLLALPIVLCDYPVVDTVAEKTPEPGDLFAQRLLEAHDDGGDASASGAEDPSFRERESEAEPVEILSVEGRG
jgi:hypothetical protein